MRNLLLALMMVGASQAAFLSTAAADDPAVGNDITFHNVTTVPIPAALEPCTHGPGAATVDYTYVFHITSFDPTVVMIASTLTGSFVFVPTGASEPTFTGHFVSSFQVQATPPGAEFNTTNEFIVVGTGADGSPLSFHEIAHIPRTPAGDITVSFDTPTCASK